MMNIAYKSALNVRASTLRKLSTYEVGGPKLTSG